MRSVIVSVLLLIMSVVSFVFSQIVPGSIFLFLLIMLITWRTLAYLYYRRRSSPDYLRKKYDPYNYTGKYKDAKSYECTDVYEFCIRDRDNLGDGDLFRTPIYEKKHVFTRKELKRHPLSLYFNKITLLKDEQQLHLTIQWIDGAEQNYTAPVDEDYRLEIEYGDATFWISLGMGFRNTGGVQPAQFNQRPTQTYHPPVIEPVGANKTERVADQIVFSAYSPRYIVKQKRYSLVVYVYHPQNEQSAIARDIEKFKDELGSSPKKRTSPEHVSIERLTPIEVTPIANGVNFEPYTLEKNWRGRWIRYNFDFMIAEDFLEEEIWIHISIKIRGFEIAQIKTSTEIEIENDLLRDPNEKMLSDNPLAKAYEERGDLMKAEAKPYRNIFIVCKRGLKPPPSGGDFQYSGRAECVGW